MNSEVARLLSHMAAFTAASQFPEDMRAVAKLMDKIANAPSVGAAVLADRTNEFGIPFCTAQLALQAVEYAVGTLKTKPEWLTQAGVE